VKLKYGYAIVLLMLILFYFIFNGEKEYRKDASVKTNSYFEGLRIVNKRSGSDAWVIAARKADFSGDETVARMYAVTINAIKEGMVLDADSGRYNMVTRELLLEENIKIRIKDSLISARSLAWNPSTRLLTSEDRVMIDGRKFRIEGDGLSATEGQKLKLTKNVRATFY
jgi:LPS export ABC transporter protein LptC